MTGTSELGLVIGTVADDHLVHLFHDKARSALCSQPRHQDPPTSGFRVAPCGACLSSALDQGHVIVRDTGSAFINLRRLAPASVSA